MIKAITQIATYLWEKVILRRDIEPPILGLTDTQMAVFMFGGLLLPLAVFGLVWWLKN